MTQTQRQRRVHQSGQCLQLLGVVKNNFPQSLAVDRAIAAHQLGAKSLSYRLAHIPVSKILQVTKNLMAQMIQLDVANGNVLAQCFHNAAHMRLSRTDLTGYAHDGLTGNLRLQLLLHKQRHIFVDKTLIRLDILDHSRTHMRQRRLGK